MPAPTSGPQPSAITASKTVEALLLEGDVRALERLARSSRGGIIVNVGAFRGGSCILLADANPLITVLAIDTFEGAVGFGGDELKREFVANVSERPNIIGLHCDSVVAAAMVCTEIEAAFIDGDHSYEKCRRDLEAWWPKIRSGGILCGHDFVDSCGVPEAVCEFVDYHRVKAIARGAGSGCHGFFSIRKP